MTKRLSSGTQKGSSGRSKSTRLRVLRFGLRALGTIAPALADRQAAGLFFTPSRGSQSRTPTVLGLEAQAFRVSSGAYDLAAWAWGEGSTVLLVHGWGGHAGQMTNFASRLAMRGYRAVAFDMPAHGASSGRQASVVDMAEAICSVAKATGSVHAVIAHSLGSAAAAIALSRGLNVDRAVLMAPVAEPSYFARRVAAWYATRPERERGVLDHIRARLGGNFEVLAIPHLSRNLCVPVMLMHDRADPEVPWEQGREIAESWPGAQLVELDGLGHFRLLRDPETVEMAIRFVASTRPTGFGAFGERPLPFAHERGAAACRGH